jgi:hypothetical protein
MRNRAIHMTQPSPTGSMSEQVSCLMCETDAPWRPGSWPEGTPHAKETWQPRAVELPKGHPHTSTDTRLATHDGIARVATRDGGRLSQMDSPNAQNEPNSARAQARGGRNRAKRTQFEKRSKFEVSSVKLEKPNQAWSDFRLHISDFKLSGKRLTASLQAGESCRTKPILERADLC